MPVCNHMHLYVSMYVCICMYMHIYTCMNHAYINVYHFFGSSLFDNIFIYEDEVGDSEEAGYND